MEAPLVPSLVDVEENVSIELLVLGLLLAIETIGRVLGKLSIGRSIELLCILVLRVIHFDTT